MKKILIFLILATPLSCLFADGVYMPERAIKNIPNIPAQRAFISWKDNNETLIISSALDSESQKLGWIIPLPNAPEKIEKIEPGALKTLTFCIQPEISHDYNEAIKAVLILSVLLLLFSGAAFSWSHKRFDYFVFFIVVFFLFLILHGVFTLASGHMGVEGRKHFLVDVLKTVRVGNYQITVLAAQKKAGLYDWLNKNGFLPLPEDSTSIIDDYIKEKWIFALIKLVRDERGRNAPHPIKMQFKSEKIVYPMKLTSLASGKTFFELFVVAPKSVECKQLNLEFCDEYSEVRDHDGIYYKGKTFHQGIGVPELRKLMWNSCVLSKFSGSLSSGEMKEDIYFQERDFVPYQETLYTVQGALSISLIIFIVLMDCLLFLFLLSWRMERKVINEFTVKWLPIGSGLAMLVSLIVYFSLPKIYSVQYSNSRLVVLMRKMEMNSELLAAKLEKSVSSKQTKKDLNKIIYEIPELSANLFQGGRIVEEATPGNYTLEDKGKGHFILTFYDLIGRPKVFDILPEKKKNKQNF